MTALQEIETLLNRATPVALQSEVVSGKVVSVARLGEGADLVYGFFPYQRRAIGVPGRLLTYERTRQPVWAVKNGDHYSPLAYAEDVEGHPLSQQIRDTLGSFVPGG